MPSTKHCNSSLIVLLALAVCSCGTDAEKLGDTNTRVHTVEEFCSRVDMLMAQIEEMEDDGEVTLPVVLTAPAGLLQESTACTVIFSECANSCAGPYVVACETATISLVSGDDDAFPVMPMPTEPCADPYPTQNWSIAIGCHGMQNVVECRPFAIPELSEVAGELAVVRETFFSERDGGFDTVRQTAVLRVTSMTSTSDVQIP